VGGVAKSQVVEHQRDSVQGLHRGYNSDLLDVLSRFRATQSTDPRDKIYGLLGLPMTVLGSNRIIANRFARYISMLPRRTLIEPRTSTSYARVNGPWAELKKGGLTYHPGSWISLAESLPRSCLHSATSSVQGARHAKLLFRSRQLVHLAWSEVISAWSHR
jgi:hypothetical protein